MDPLVNYEYPVPPQEYQQKRYQNPNQVPEITNKEQVVPQSALPATPRMLRSVSGNQKNSGSDSYSQEDQPAEENDRSMTPQQLDKYQQYVSSANYQMDASHSKNSSLNQPQHSKRGTSASHSRTPSVNRQPQPPPTPPTWNSQFPNQPNQQQPVTSPQRKQELLPPAAISSPSSKPPTVGNAASANKTRPMPQQHPGQNNEHGHHHHSHHHNQQQQALQQQQQQQFHRKSIGDWDFIKTIGAGSMGKVKLAQHNSTSEICAVKIVPRAAKLFQRAHANDPPILNAQAAAQRQKEFEKEVTRDKRTIREGALGRLLFHPFICRLYEMVPMTNHYYMLFEYVEGGQMLDYIVSHGSLKEKNARKFARGIALALEYCHSNNVVHRDLKIENIMINSKGDIKIIDFGLSNLYSPKSLLKTYCGSLYFAAPELLSAKPYTGPEVDVWSFGVVLYVLVCGKVPFDDQSVSILHEKIKRGNVEYPSFLSKECVSLLSRMLVVDPTKRASLFEVVQHPWMNRGYEAPQSCYLPKRKPLELPLDPEIVKSIASFDIGTVQSVTEEMTSILTSVEYQMSCENWYKITEKGRKYASAPNAHILPDPTGGFHPLISIYYLVHEMKMRKKAKEHSAKAQLEQANSKQASQQGNLQAPRQDETLQYEPEQQKREERLPGLSFPEQAHTSASPATFQKSSPSPPRDQKEESIPEQQPHSPRESMANTDTLDPNGGKPGGFNSLFRRLSSKKYKNSPSSPNRNQTSPDASDHNIAPPPIPRVSIVPDSQEHIPSPSSNKSHKNDPMVRRGVSMKVTAKEKSSSSKVDLHSSTSNTPKPQPEVSTQPTKTSHNRSSSTSTNNAVNKYRGYVPEQYLPPLPNINPNTNTLVPPASGSNSPLKVAPGAEGRKLHPTARAKSVGGHVRKESYGRSNRAQKQPHPTLPNALASQNSDEIIDEGSTRDDGFFDDVTLDEVDYQEIPQLTEEQIIDQFNHAKQNSMPSIEYPKTLFLKGFFSVQTTSTKPLPVIRYNIINVLSKLGVKFQEVKGGFVCAHAPSLQIKPAQPDDISTNTSTMIDSQQEEKKSEETSEEQRLYGDAFKSTSSSIERNSDIPTRIKTPEQNPGESQMKSPTRQASLHLNTQNLSPPSANSGKTHRPSNSVGGHRRKFSIGNSLLGSYRKKNGSQIMMPPNTPATAKLNKLLYGMDGDELEDEDEDETSKQFTEDDSVDSLNGLMIGGGSDMLISSTLEHKAKHQHSPSSGNSHLAKRSPLKFEIHIVKVPLVGLYGVQFKKLLGNTWNYKTLAGQILNELNL